MRRPQSAWFGSPSTNSWLMAWLPEFESTSRSFSSRRWAPFSTRSIRDSCSLRWSPLRRGPRKSSCGTGHCGSLSWTMRMDLHRMFSWQIRRCIAFQKHPDFPFRKLTSRERSRLCNWQQQRPAPAKHRPSGISLPEPSRHRQACLCRPRRRCLGWSSRQRHPSKSRASVLVTPSMLPHLAGAVLKDQLQSVHLQRVFHHGL